MTKLKISNSIQFLISTFFQASDRKVCLHRNLLLLARNLFGTGNYPGQPPQEPPAAKKTGDEDGHSRQLKSTMQIQVNKEIPYTIPPQTLNQYYLLVIRKNERLSFEPYETKCTLCQSPLGDSVFPQGTRSTNGNGYLITNLHSFVKVDIKMKKCSNKNCKAAHVAYPFKNGNTFVLTLG